MSFLDQFRDRPGQGKPARTPSLADVLAAGGQTGSRLTTRSRRALWIALAALAVVAIAHPFLTEALASGTGGNDPLQFGATVLSWPSPAVQPVICAAAVAALIVLAIFTRGFSWATARATRAAMTAIITGSVAALPFALVLLGFALLLALAVAIIVAIIWIIIAILTGG
jgi:hypothetical protein